MVYSSRANCSRCSQVSGNPSTGGVSPLSSTGRAASTSRSKSSIQHRQARHRPGQSSKHFAKHGEQSRLANLPSACPPSACPPCLRSSCSRCSRTGVKALLLVATGVSPRRSRNWNSSLVARLNLLLGRSSPRAAMSRCNSRRMVHNMWSRPLRRFIWDLTSSLLSNAAKRSRIRVRSLLETSQRDRHKGQRTAAVTSSGFQTCQSSYLSARNSHFEHLFVVRPVPDPRSLS
mmetsp:Transcript_69219/g.195419  ORF Transcript_69219/g.195419 Transcript_69219/m.195419 type:complete len:232 (-) Transcript_69219:922-1617(-)